MLKYCLIQIHHKILGHSLETQIVIKKSFFFFNKCKNEWKELICNLMKKGQKSDFKCDFYKNKKLFMIDDTGVNKILH